MPRHPAAPVASTGGAVPLTSNRTKAIGCAASMAVTLRQIARHIPGARRVWRALHRPRVDPAPTGGPDLALHHVEALERRFPQLREFGLPLSGATAPAVLSFYNAYLPLIYPAARGAHLRSLLTRLRTACPALAEAATREIATSDLTDGLPDRAQILRSDPDAHDALRRQTEEFEAQYGAALITTPWTGASRGAALLYYLENHPELSRGKDVLHVAPEGEARGWLLANARRYVTLDGTPGHVDFVHDVTAIDLPSASFDTVICHRVLEHVLDDHAAMRELHRVLRAGGVLNLSVPQAAHRDHTAEWVVPDESHHGHVRQYGRDLLARLSAAGFRVEVEPWLLLRPRDELLRRSAFPMRMFNCVKV